MEIVTALMGAFVGGLIAAVTGLYLYKLQRREQITQKYIDEFLSENMLRHRIVAGNLRERLRDKTPDDNGFSIEALARGFWNAGPDVSKEYYKGPVDPHTGLNEHQSLEAILQYVSRLIMNIERNNIDIEDYKAAVQGSFVWLDDLLLPFEKEVKRQVEEHRKEGGVVRAINRINRLHKLRHALELQS